MAAAGGTGCLDEFTTIRTSFSVNKRHTLLRRKRVNEFVWLLNSDESKLRKSTLLVVLGFWFFFTIIVLVLKEIDFILD